MGTEISVPFLWVMKFLYHLNSVILFLGTEIFVPLVHCCYFYYLGTTVIAGMQAERNIVNIEKSAINFIDKKTRTVELLSILQVVEETEDETAGDTVEG